jgi:hypothetical protein
MSSALVKWLVAISGLVLAGWVYAFAYNHVRFVRVEDLFDPRYKRKDSPQAYFERSFPSHDDIARHLSNVTLVISNPPRGSEVFYFGSDQTFLTWHAGTVVSDRWWTEPELQILRLGDQRRWVVVQIFCTAPVDPPDDARLDNCYHASAVEGIPYQVVTGRTERADGNVFGLASGKRPPFALPESEISLALLSQRISETRSLGK